MFYAKYQSAIYAFHQRRLRDVWCAADEARNPVLADDADVRLAIARGQTHQADAEARAILAADVRSGKVKVRRGTAMRLGVVSKEDTK